MNRRNPQGCASLARFSSGPVGSSRGGVGVMAGMESWRAQLGQLAPNCVNLLSRESASPPLVLLYPFANKHCFVSWQFGQEIANALRKMEPRTQARLEVQARILYALAHPSRLFVVEELSRGGRCVCELTGMIGSDMSTVSKHLSVLRSAGIVGDRKRGAQVYLRNLRSSAARALGGS